MIENIKKNLLPIILLLVVGGYGIYFYFSVSREDYPGENDYRMGNKYLEDNKLDEAISYFNRSLLTNPQNDATYLGKGITLMYQKKFDESRINFGKAISLNKNFAEAYANRAILNDMTERYEDALKDYVLALKLKPKLGEGPGMIWKFFNSQGEKTSTIADRAMYIRNELKKPKNERKLKSTQKDEKQKMYTPGKLL